MWIKNTDGKEDAVLTMAVASMIVVLLKVIASGLSIAVASKTTLSFGTIDATLVGALLTPTLGAYCARRYTERKFPVDENMNGIIDPEEKEE